MIVVSSREFRSNQKKYLDLADKNEQIVSQRKGARAYVLSPVTGGDSFFMDPQNLAEVKKGIEEYRAGKAVTVDNADIDKLLGL